jgi:HK97 family phage major capsid protein
MPEGIAISKFINSLTLGTGNGAMLSGYDDILKGILQIANANAPIPSGAIMNPRTLINYSMLKDGDGKPLVRPDIIAKLQFYDTTKMPINSTVGTANNCSSIVLGSFDQLVIGFRQQIDMLVLRERYSEFGQIAFQVSMRVDTAVYQPNAFCLINGILPNS